MFKNELEIIDKTDKIIYKYINQQISSFTKKGGVELSKKQRNKRKSIRYSWGKPLRRGGGEVTKKVYKLSLERGRAAEIRIEHCLETLKKEKMIRDFCIFPPYSYKDKKGIDGEIYIGKEKIPFQIKSSFRGAENHLQKYGGDIPVIVVTPDIEDETLCEKIKNILAERLTESI